MNELRVGVVGCGNISGIYFKTLLAGYPARAVAAADLDAAKAQQAAETYGVRAMSVDELMASPDIDVVLNLTIPKAHAAVSIQALNHGKHVYVEKPLGVTREEGRQVVELARQKGLLLGCAPDTVLGAGIQTARSLIEEGAIGKPVHAQGFMLCPGHESWHPAPEFYYKAGGGPMLDMGPYYVTALITLLGPIARVAGIAATTFEKRTITSQPLNGTLIEVETPTHIAGLMEFESGAAASLTTSFDVQGHPYPPIVVLGSEGTLEVPDPNGFGGPVRLRRRGERDYTEIPLRYDFAENSRGLGVIDIALAANEQRAPRASGDLGFHVLDAMLAFEESSISGEFIRLDSRPAPAKPMIQGELELVRP